MSDGLDSRLSNFADDVLKSRLICLGDVQKLRLHKGGKGSGRGDIVETIQTWSLYRAEKWGYVIMVSVTYRRPRYFRTFGPLISYPLKA